MAVRAEPVGGIGVIVSRHHEELVLLHLGRRCIKLGPVRQVLLYGVRVITSQNFLRDRSSIDEDARGGLPCDRLEDPVVRRSHLLRKGKLIFQLLIGKPQLLPDIQRIVAVYIDSQIFFRRKIEIHLVILVEILRREKPLREKLHVFALIIRDDPVYRDISDFPGSVPDILIAGIVQQKKRLE